MTSFENMTAAGIMVTLVERMANEIRQSNLPLRPGEAEILLKRFRPPNKRAAEAIRNMIGARKGTGYAFEPEVEAFLLKHAESWHHAPLSSPWEE